MQYRSSWMTEELDVFRDQFRKFLAKDLAPHAEKWREQKMVDRFAWRGWTLEVLDMDGRRVDKILVLRKPRVGSDGATATVNT